MTRPERDVRAHRSPSPRWWLAGLLIGCLLPIGLGQARLDPVTERLIRVCFHTPAMIRAVSRRHSIQRRTTLSMHRCRLLDGRLRAPRRAVMHVLPMTAGHDTLSRRGPPLGYALS